ncbi:TetR/AcrR family transcriptional regulator [Kingella negevensis]|uniref:TetR/AcrR family transcriptional regulator n=1 Tax=Kingella negevensis TaxID=1522312 RepID=UPI00050A3138|nr:TetR/AcrR family transcriptional regulator [Kingella negevensis]MDK4688839.1 TetR/AcrR family transcriptional regulator [Kingella negevensis]WII92103.1 TetR/AcrR family transcriptional regulator [Kingella negevensis]
MTKKTTKPNTYNRIIDASLVLFNEQGERNISTNHIASYMGISPGNLYYHFTNKDEIIVQLFKRYTQALVTYVAEEDKPQSVRDAFEFMAGAYDILWEYRFLFSDINTLLERGKDLLGEHKLFSHEQISPMMKCVLSHLRESGIIKMDDIALNDLTINIWLVSKYWFDFHNSLYGADNAQGHQIKARGVARTLSLLRPYFAEQYLAEFDALNRELLNN